MPHPVQIRDNAERYSSSELVLETTVGDRRGHQMTSQPSSPMPHRHPIDVQINIIISEIHAERYSSSPKDSTPEVQHPQRVHISIDHTSYTRLR